MNKPVYLLTKNKYSFLICGKLIKEGLTMLDIPPGYLNRLVNRLICKGGS